MVGWQGNKAGGGACRGGRSARGPVGAWLAVVGGAFLALPSARAQFMANQGGTALSADLSRSNPYASTGRDFAAEARYRNSIAFGTAPGGLSFQGGLGYRDPHEFTGHLGTSSLNNFNRNSVLSTIASTGIRREQAFDAQSALATGNGRSPFLPNRGSINFNAFNVARSAYRQDEGASLLTGAIAARGASSLTSLAANALVRDRSLDRSYNVTNRLGKNFGQSSTGGAPARLGGLSSSSAYTDVSRGNDLSERLGISRRISDLNSIDNYRTDLSSDFGSSRTLAGAARSNSSAMRLAGDSERARTRIEAARPGEQGTGRVETSAAQLPNIRPDLKAGAGATRLGVDTSYDELRKKLDKYGLGIPGVNDQDATKAGDTRLPSRGQSEAQRRLDELRGSLRPDETPGTDRMSLLDRTRSPRKKDTTGAGDTQRPSDTARPSADRPTPDGEQTKSLRSRIDPETLKMIREASGSKRLDNLVSGDVSKRDFYGEHMRAGQRLLSEGMYFDAEDRFSRALQIKPADPSAQTGRIHAQIGAGLSLSAGQGLRKLISEYPETTAQRYAQSLRPAPDRTARIIDQLRENIAGTGKLRRESALLMAYLGFQAGNLALTREGLDAMSRVALEDPAAKAGGDERLVELLRGVWLDPKLYDAPAEGAATPAAPASAKPEAPK